MTKYQMILEIVSYSDDYNYSKLRQLWSSELKVLHHAIMKEKKKLSEETIYNVEEDNNEE